MAWILKSSFLGYDGMANLTLAPQDLQVDVCVDGEFAHEEMPLQDEWVLVETKLGHLLISVFQRSLEVME